MNCLVSAGCLGRGTIKGLISPLHLQGWAFLSLAPNYLPTCLSVSTRWKVPNFFECATMKGDPLEMCQIKAEQPSLSAKHD